MTTLGLTGQEQGREQLARWRAEGDANAFAQDTLLQGVLERILGPRYGEAARHLRAVAEAAGSAVDAAVAESNRDENLPRLRNHDGFGRENEEVVFHPAYHEVGRVFWSSGVLAALGAPGNGTLAGAIAYLLDRHGEAGHACPVACTAGAIKLIQRLGTVDQQRRYLPDLVSDDYDRRLHAAQFVTEVQGGSDVGLNACEARPEPGRPGWFRITGEKWFCSVADAGLFVVSARPAGAGSGTRGLGLFLVPRRLDGRPNGFRLRRLKTKLGTRSMATGEVEFDGALGEAIGPLDAGFKNLVAIVLDTSRLHNAVAACGIMRRAESEAVGYARHRKAFERPIGGFPAVQEILARMRVRRMAAVATTFRVLALSDLIDAGTAGAGAVEARRIAVMINKMWTALACTQSVRDGIEILGGNGTIEEFSVLPRLYRDAIVIESWEGTHNTLCAQVLRDFAVRRLHEPWLALLEKEIAGIDAAGLTAEAERSRELLERARRGIVVAIASEEAGARLVRTVVERMCQVTDWVALATQLAWDQAKGRTSELADALDFYQLAWIDRADALDAPDRAAVAARLAAVD